jgi:hypothetical protein
MTIPPPSLPAGLSNTGDLTAVSKNPETDAADAELAHISPGTAAKLTAIVLAYLEFGLAHCFGNH